MEDATLSFTEDDKNMLVRIVKVAQQREIKGTVGGWAEYVALNNVKQLDPDVCSWETLAKFVQTFSSQDGIQMVKRMRKWYGWISETKLADQNDPWPETPEQCLVKITHQNPRYYHTFSFPSYEKGWKWTERGPSSSPQNLLSLDCEMVMCEGYEYQVVQVCVVDRNFETVLNTLVKPSKKVLDYITHIHGIKSADLKKATCTQEEIQNKVIKLLKPGTILVGHSVNNDLKALKIDHQRIIDTSMMMRPKGISSATPISLDALCKAFLGYSIREEGKHHDCLEDAIVPMKLVLHELQNGPSLPKKVISRDANRLFVHKIPQHVMTEDLRKLISDAVPCSIEKIEGKKAQAYAVFPTKDLADEAFVKLPGEAGLDTAGFQQKTVPRWNRAQYVEFRVRKMVHDEFVSRNPSAMKRSVAQEAAAAVVSTSKRLKPTPEADQSTSICSCGRVEEVEKLKQQLQESKAEVVALKKLITSLKK